jgi:hypothetical protein
VETHLPAPLRSARYLSCRFRCCPAHLLNVRCRVCEQGSCAGWCSTPATGTWCALPRRCRSSRTCPPPRSSHAGERGLRLGLGSGSGLGLGLRTVHAPSPWLCALTTTRDAMYTALQRRPRYTIGRRTRLSPLVDRLSEGSSLSPGKRLHHQRSSSSHDASPHPQGSDQRLWQGKKDPLNSAFLDELHRTCAAYCPATHPPRAYTA